MIADLQAQGLTEAAAREAAASMGGEASALRLPWSMRPLVNLLVACMGQWRMGGGGLGAMAPVALDMVALDVAARWLGITPDAALLRDLQTVETEALRLMRAKP